MNWTFSKDIYEQAVVRSTHKYLNHNIEHFNYKYIIKNRNIRSKMENKPGPHLPGFGMVTCEQQTFLYKSKQIYSKIPREITMIQNKITF